VPHRAAAPGGVLQDGRDLVEGQVVRAAEFQGLPAQPWAGRQAADILWTYSSPELYELLVIRRGWPAEQYGRFVGQALTAALLPAQAT
jgi:hypothetical protein